MHAFITHHTRTYLPYQLPVRPRSLGRHGNLPHLCISPGTEIKIFQSFKLLWHFLLPPKSRFLHVTAFRLGTLLDHYHFPCLRSPKYNYNHTCSSHLLSILTIQPSVVLKRSMHICMHTIYIVLLYLTLVVARPDRLCASIQYNFPCTRKNDKLLK